MALEGTLKDFSLADIFQLIGLQRKTGVLTLRGKDDTVTVTFLDGKVVAADSLNKRLENRLGNVLVKRGMLTPEKLNQALEIQRETLQRLGFILTNYEIISQEDLRQALQLQIMQIVYRLFRWKDGEYHFSQETTIEYDRDNVVPITAESILMEGARMIDEWPIIEKRIRSFDMVFRHKPIAQEIVVVDADEAEIDFDDTATRSKKGGGDRIKISPEEKSVYDLVDGERNVGEIVEMSRFNEFDTAKALYELLTRDLIEEVRKASPAADEADVSDAAPAEVPSAVPLPLVVLLVAIAVGLLLFSSRNPLNSLSPISRSTGAVTELRKAISLQRIEELAEAIEAYNLATGNPPGALADLVPHYAEASIVSDPWGHPYKYILHPDTYLLVGFTPEGRPDTDLFLSRSIGLSTPVGRQPTGGVELVD